MPSFAGFRRMVAPCLLVALAALVSGCAVDTPRQADNKTFCNPMNLSYRYREDEPSRREAADPLIVVFKDAYYLIASKSGGYWRSDDLVSWTFIKPTGLPIEDYAPAACVIGDSLYYTAFDTGAIFVTANPDSGIWTKSAETKRYSDPCLFCDDDGRVYMYYGCAPNGPLSCVELDPKNGFREIGTPVVTLRANIDDHGWERRGDYNNGTPKEDGTTDFVPWIEGSWMTKHNGTYYLQYAGPGTEFATYADGIYTSSSPTGPFTYQDYSPASHKPTGFIAGAGHGGTFQDKQGNYWRIVTGVISIQNMFERRLELFPAGFDADGVFWCDTTYGDWPQPLPTLRAVEPFSGPLTGMLLISRGAVATASSSRETYPATNASDENIKTQWCAATTGAEEWLQLDLGQACTIASIQVNMGEVENHIFARADSHAVKYRIEASSNGKSWKTIIDRSKNTADTPHDYQELAKPATARYIRLTGISLPEGSPIAVRDLRVFGIAPGSAPAAITFTAERNPQDGREMVVRWPAQEAGVTTVVRYGVNPDKLHNQYEIAGTDSVRIAALNRTTDYYVTVDVVNGAGITPGAAPTVVAAPKP